MNTRHSVKVCAALLLLSSLPALAQGVGQQMYIEASNPDVADLFGSAVASPETRWWWARTLRTATRRHHGNQADNSAFRAGAAYVYGVWVQQAYLKAWAKRCEKKNCGF